ncbi:MAG: retroviral-like aspartic protease family protein [Acidimicrobiaceae bacterium]|nr:retroviral-like aspartic protease family protein [Acidimicrobiaceae bacterium]
MPTFSVAVEDNSIIIAVTVANPGEFLQEPKVFTALVDTGATTSMISPAVVEAIGAVNTGYGSYTSANGAIEETELYLLHIAVPVSEVTQGADGGQQIGTFIRGSNLERVLLMPPPNPEDARPVDVILGMDFLVHFHITMWAGQFVLSN